MTVKACICIILISILSYNYTLAQQASASEIETLITQTWYSYQVGDPELREMNPTKNHEELVFNSDGTVKFTVLHNMMGKMEYIADWTYNEDTHTIDFEIELEGRTEKQSVQIDELDEENMVLVSPQKITTYSTVKSDAFRESANNETIADSNAFNLDQWTGVITFNEAALYEGDEVNETYPSKGQIELLRDGEKLQIRHTENGYVDLYTVSQGNLSMGGKRHYVIITDVPELAGGYFFGEDGQVIYYRDKDESTVEYYMKKD